MLRKHMKNQIVNSHLVVLPFGTPIAPQSEITKTEFKRDKLTHRNKGMGDKSKSKNKQESRPDSNPQLPGVNGKPKIGKKEYEAEIFKLQVELVKLQDWVKTTNA